MAVMGVSFHLYITDVGRGAERVAEMVAIWIVGAVIWAGIAG